MGVLLLRSRLLLMMMAPLAAGLLSQAMMRLKVPRPLFSTTSTTETPQKTPQNGEGNHVVVEYRRAADDSAEVDVEAVEALVRERALARSICDYKRSDAAAAELKRSYNVTCNNKSRTWRASPRSYVRDPEDDAPGLDEAQERRFSDLAKARAEARRLTRYVTADELRLELAAMGVHVDDQRRTWVYLGPAYKPRKAARQYTALDPQQKRDVMMLVEMRRRYKIKKRFAKADDILLRLLTEFNVCIDDENQTWNTVPRHTAMQLLERLTTTNFIARDIKQKYSKVLNQ